GTRLEWTGGVSYDYYQNNSRGGFTLTPIRDESANNTGQVQTEKNRRERTTIGTRSTRPVEHHGTPRNPPPTPRIACRGLQRAMAAVAA
ncbi:MAG: hypothetical protein IT486_12805, partial [Gammaproteobacteria bacterium]|nr:hypothetical protein [Gammaproteobacteria bacterium]